MLRYFSDAYKALVQNVPEDLKSATLRDLSEWLGEMVRQVDSSLLDEWELLMHPDELEAALARGERPTPGLVQGEPPPLTANLRAFRVMVRNASFRRVELAARRDWATLGEMDQDAGWDAARWEAASQPTLQSTVRSGLAPRRTAPLSGSCRRRAGAGAYGKCSTTRPGTTNGPSSRRRPRCFGPERGAGHRAGRASSDAVASGTAAGASGLGGCRRRAANLQSMAMRPMGRDEGLQHLFVLATAVFLIVAPIFLVEPPPLRYSLMGLGAFFARSTSS